jgi:hypothetical protein
MIEVNEMQNEVLESIFKEIHWNEIEPKAVEGVSEEMLTEVKRKICRLYEDGLPKPTITEMLSKEFPWVSMEHVVSPTIVGYSNYMIRTELYAKKRAEGKETTTKEEEQSGGVVDVLLGGLSRVYRKPEKQVYREHSVMELIRQYDSMASYYENLYNELGRTKSKDAQKALIKAQEELIDISRNLVKAIKEIDRSWGVR